MKNTQEVINSRLHDTEDCMSIPEDRVEEITKTEKQKGIKSKDSLRDLKG